jgi:23S rRNA (adenine2503-C2)-methyltransferase
MTDMTLSARETTLPLRQDSTAVPDRTDLFGLDFAELGDWMIHRGLPAFRAQQLATWLYHSMVPDFALMRTLPAALRAQLEQECTIQALQVRAEVVSKDGRTRKLLLELLDGRLIETVLMLYPPTSEGRARATVCVSTQAGCAYGCTFCATGQMGFFRHLTPGEIVAQVVYFARWLHANPWRAAGGQAIDHLTNLVFMGMGEPLHNYDNTLKAVRILNMPEGLHIGARHMTISTVGLVPGIIRLSAEALQVNLAISLHAPSDEMRVRTMPVTRKYPLQAVLEACRTYAARTNRQVTFEYVLLAGINDHPEHARELATLLLPLLQLCHVNLIPVNATSAGYTPPSGEVIRRFRDELSSLGVSNSVRAERGDDIAAACGQLHTLASQKSMTTDLSAVAEIENQA